MRIQFRNGMCITNSRENYKLDEDTECLEDAFCFQNAREISKERFKLFMKEIKK